MDLATAVELRPTKVVAGGVGLAREASGRVVLVEGALPGELVRAEVVEERRDLARARTVEVLEPSADRVPPPCAEVAAGCGGCDLQHVAPAAQPALKVGIVADALRRLGRVDDPPVRAGAPLAAAAWRTTVRAVVDGGRAGFRRRGSHEAHPVPHCLVAHPLLDDLLAPVERGGADFGAAAEVVLRCGARTGERLVVASPTAEGVRVPDGVLLVGDDELRRGRRAWIHEEVAGRRFRISAGSFFQARPDGAEALAEAVVALGGDELAGAATVVDAYAGVGLFAGLLLAARPERRVVAVEWSRSSVADATRNLDGERARVVRSDVARWRPMAADAVVADPSRSGLGPRGAAALAGSGASVLVLVSCDAAALGRDAALLAGHGFRLDDAVVVDLFPHTHHVEVVSRFVR